MAKRWIISDIKEVNCAGVLFDSYERAKWGQEYMTLSLPQWNPHVLQEVEVDDKGNWEMPESPFANNDVQHNQQP
jgi:hypothetical protein